MNMDYARIDPELRPALEAFPELHISRENLHQVRALLGELAEASPSRDVREAELSIPAAHGSIRVVSYKKSDSPKQAGLLWIHGGGYLMGTAEDDRARIIAHHCDCTVFSVEYRLAPEHPFPAGLDDCRTVLHWVAAHAEELGIDAHRLAIGGASAGGGLGAGLALRNRDEGGPSIAFQLLLYPMIDNLHETNSGRIENHPVWNRRTSFNAWEMYLDGEPGLEASPYAAASRATSLQDLPPAYICVGTEDLFRDENIAYAQRLIASGVACELAVLPGMYHGGDGFVPTARVSERMQNSYLEALRDGLR